MFTEKINMKRFTAILLLAFGMLLLPDYSAQAQWFKSKRAAAKAQRDKEKSKTPYDKIVKADKAESVHGPLLSLHKSEGKIYMEIPTADLGKDMLLASTTSSVSTPQLGTTGFKQSNPVHVRFVQKDSTIVMEVVNTSFVYDKVKEPNLVEADRLNFGNISFLKFDISAHSNDKKAVLFDVSSFFLEDNRFFPVAERRVGPYSVNANLKSNLTRITGLKVFEDNATIKVRRTYSVSLSDSKGNSPLSDYPATFDITFTLLKLPEVPMTPRLADTRLGVFQTRLFVSDTVVGKIVETGFVNRWRIEPSDMEAYLAGKLTKPVKPIVFYIDSAFPAEWKEPIRQGILRWNKAFERIGFKDAVEARDYPTDDPEFDPDNLKYSCLRYIPVAIENAMGPSWVDPRSGEIINASVFVYNDVTKLINSWRFVQTAQVDPRVRSKKMPDEIIASTLQYVVAHEIGHTLGFMHNMAASSAFPVDSLRSASFTQKYGTTPSIMDYARFNYVAQPGDEGVAFEPPFLGVYDYFLVKWTYLPFPHLGGDFRREFIELDKIVKEHEGDPMYRHGVQQFELRIDPSAIEEDLGDDPVKAGGYGMRNLEYIMAHLDEWITDDEDSNHKAALYEEIVGQALRYATNVFMNVSGVYLSQTSESSNLLRTKVVAKEKQRASALWLLRKSLEFDKLGNPSLEKKLYAAANRPFSLYQKYIMSMALAATGKLTFTHYLDSTSYSPLEYSRDVYDFVFDKTIRGDETLTESERTLQRVYVETIARTLESQTQIAIPFALSQSMSEELPIRKYACCADHAHHAQGDPRVSYSGHTLLGFGQGYGEPTELWTATINDAEIYIMSNIQETAALLEKAIARTGDAELKLHYTTLLSKLKQSGRL